MFLDPTTIISEGLDALVPEGKALPTSRHNKHPGGVIDPEYQGEIESLLHNEKTRKIVSGVQIFKGISWHGVLNENDPHLFIYLNVS